MTHNELIEAVARAWCESSGKDPDKLTPAPRGVVGLVPLWTLFEPQARAAIRMIAPAVLEDVAALMEGKGGVIPLAASYARFVSGNEMPHPSGDDRNRIRHEHERRRFDRVTEDVAHAIRALKTRYE